MVATKPPPSGGGGVVTADAGGMVALQLCFLACGAQGKITKNESKLGSCSRGGGLQILKSSGSKTHYKNLTRIGIS